MLADAAKGKPDMLKDRNAIAVFLVRIWLGRWKLFCSFFQVIWFIQLVRVQKRGRLDERYCNGESTQYILVRNDEVDS